MESFTARGPAQKNLQLCAVERASVTRKGGFRKVTKRVIYVSMFLLASVALATEIPAGTAVTVRALPSHCRSPS
ncbi:MAG: hypothetical protein IT165_25120 [Bryobacterales bacterium]|nr:hypothetical protein [Bryobacterales bacterium]